jgi:hypothetical protein
MGPNSRNQNISLSTTLGTDERKQVPQSSWLISGLNHRRKRATCEYTLTRNSASTRFPRFFIKGNRCFYFPFSSIFSLSIVGGHVEQCFPRTFPYVGRVNTTPLAFIRRLLRSSDGCYNQWKKVSGQQPFDCLNSFVTKSISLPIIFFRIWCLVSR